MRTILLTLITTLLLVSCKKEIINSELPNHILIDKYLSVDTNVAILGNGYKDYIYNIPKGYAVDSIYFISTVDTAIYRVYNESIPTTIYYYNQWYKLSNKLTWFELKWLASNRCNQLKISITKQYY